MIGMRNLGSSLLKESNNLSKKTRQRITLRNWARIRQSCPRSRTCQLAKNQTLHTRSVKTLTKFWRTCVIYMRLIGWHWWRSCRIIRRQKNFKQHVRNLIWTSKLVCWSTRKEAQVKTRTLTFTSKSSRFLADKSVSFNGLCSKQEWDKL